MSPTSTWRSCVSVHLIPSTVLQSVTIFAVVLYGLQQADDISRLRRELFEVRLTLTERQEGAPPCTSEVAAQAADIKEFPAKMHSVQKRSVVDAARHNRGNRGLTVVTSPDVSESSSVLDKPDPTPTRARTRRRKTSSKRSSRRQRKRKLRGRSRQNRRQSKERKQSKCEQDCPATSNVIRRETEGKQRTKSVHFIANVDSERLARLPLNDSSRPGFFDKGAFIPEGRILKIWQPQGWMDTSRFFYNQSSGMARVKKRGIYMVYAQVVFHDSAARKSIGLYINDNVVPIVEAISFDLIHSQRSGSTNEVLSVNTRSKRMPKLYSQCNFMGMVHLRKNDRLSIKCSEDDRGILAKDYLTYWGITHISKM